MNTPKTDNRGKGAVGYVEEGTAFMELGGGQNVVNGEERTRQSPSLPSRLTENAFAFQRTAALRAAVDLDIFTAIGEDHDTPAELGERCSAAEHSVRILCDFLADLSLLDQTDERWQAFPGSALETAFEEVYDVALVVRFLHLLAADQREALLRRVHAALTPGRRIVALQVMLNNDHVLPPFAVMMNFNLLATTPSGRVPAVGELEALLRNTGFQNLEWHDLPDSDVRAVIGWKQA